MSKYITIISLTLFIGILSACQPTPDSAEIQQLQQQVTSLESRLDELNQGADVSGLETRLDALESRLGEQGANVNPDTGANDQVFQVTIASYLMDTAGFHDLDDRINSRSFTDLGRNPAYLARAS